MNGFQALVFGSRPPTTARMGLQHLVNTSFFACVTPYVILAGSDPELCDAITYHSVESVVVEMFKEGDPRTLSFVWRADVPPESIERACDIFRHGEPERHQFWDDETHNEPASSGPRKKAEPVQISELDALIKKMRDNLAGIPEGDFEIDEDEVAIDDLDFGKSVLSKLKDRQASVGKQPEVAG